MLKIRVPVDLTGRGEFIDDFRQILRKQTRGLLGIEAKLAGDAGDLVIAQHTLNLFCRDAHVFTQPHPGASHLAQAVLAKLAQQP